MWFYSTNTKPYKAENTRYKKTVQELEQELSRIPTDNEIANRMGVFVGLLPKLEIQIQGITSLDTPLSDDDSLTLTDTAQTDFSLENESTFYE